MWRTDYYLWENIEEIYQQKTHFALTIPVMSLPSFLPFWRDMSTSLILVWGKYSNSSRVSDVCSNICTPVFWLIPWCCLSVLPCCFFSYPLPRWTRTSGWCRLALGQLCWSCSFPQAPPAPRVLLLKWALLLSCAKCLSHSPHWKWSLRFF